MSLIDFILKPFYMHIIVISFLQCNELLLLWFVAIINNLSFSVQTVVLSVKRIVLFPHWQSVKTLTQCWMEVMIASTLTLFPVLQENIQSFNIKFYVTWTFLQMPFSTLGRFPSIPSVLRVLTFNDCLFFFFNQMLGCICWDTCIIFVIKLLWQVTLILKHWTNIKFVR